MAQNAVKFIPLATFNTATADGTLQLINSGGLPEACTMLYIVNDSNISVYISFDGVTNHFVVPDQVGVDFAAQTNSQPGNRVQMFRKGMTIWLASVSGAAGVGNVYVSGIYTEPE
jgi:hypothetical protein